MKNLSSGLLLISIMITACSTQSHKPVTQKIKNKPADTNIVTRSDISSSAAKSNLENDTLVIKPVHKRQYQKKFKLK